MNKLKDKNQSDNLNDFLITAGITMLKLDYMT